MQEYIIPILSFIGGGGITAVITLPFLLKKERISADVAGVTGLLDKINSYSKIIDSLDDRCMKLTEKLTDAENRNIEYRSEYAELEMKYVSLERKYNVLQSEFNQFKESMK